MPFRHSDELRLLAVARVRGGETPVAVSRSIGVSSTTVYAWLHEHAPELVRTKTACCRCLLIPTLPQDPAAYAHLLGLYLGDGYLTRGPRAWCLRITCDDGWPGLADEAEDAIRHVSGNKIHRVRKPGCHDLQAYSQHWLCLFPQHGFGKKHERPIMLEEWQQQVVSEHPGMLLRGLFHSDGWRGHNVAVHRAHDGFVTRYRYSRYEFTNKSADIRGICTNALDLLGIAWRPNGTLRISVNRRDAVAALDLHVGPKF